VQSTKLDSKTVQFRKVGRKEGKYKDNEPKNGSFFENPTPTNICVPAHVCKKHLHQGKDVLLEHFTLLMAK